jgi:hypothetical protein
MSVVDKEVLVTVRLPRGAYQRITEAAARAHRSVEEEVAERVTSTLTDEGSVEEAFDEAYQAYLSHLREEGRQPLSTSELWDQMRRIREQIANELNTR